MQGEDNYVITISNTEAEVIKKFVSIIDNATVSIDNDDVWDEDYYCEERIKDIDNLLKYSDYRLEYPDGDRLRFSKDGGWPSFNLKINTPIPDKDFYVELYTESSGCPHWIVYTSFYEKYNLLLR